MQVSIMYNYSNINEWTEFSDFTDSTHQSKPKETDLTACRMNSSVLINSTHT